LGSKTVLRNDEVACNPSGESLTMLPNRRDNNHSKKPENPVWCDPEFKDTYPCIEAFLCGEKYSDGTVRSTGSLSYFYKYGSLIVAVNDNDRNLTAFVSAGTMGEIMFMIEEGLAKDSLDWRKKSTNGFSQKPPF
jgi:hypothetical protein